MKLRKQVVTTAEGRPLYYFNLSTLTISMIYTS
jgi:hypothetical protein